MISLLWCLFFPFAGQLVQDRQRSLWVRLNVHNVTVLTEQVVEAPFVVDHQLRYHLEHLDHGGLRALGLSGELFFGGSWFVSLRVSILFAGLWAFSGAQ